MINELILGDCFDLLPNIKSKSIDLILIDPPYFISKDSNYTKVNDNTSDLMKLKYSKLSIDYGDWDKKDIDFEFLFKEYYRILKKGGTIIIFYDIWKAADIKKIANDVGFKQPRVCCWIKNNPVPINSKCNYLSNASEYFFTFVKHSKPTFNSKYDKGFYNYPLCHGKERFDHPTQKPYGLIKELILKHSNEGDLVLDTFAGTYTTSVVCRDLNRNFISIEKEEKYFKIGKERYDKD
jgi:site-specific DNA-methyltransferase (adenine-specific)